MSAKSSRSSSSSWQRSLLTKWRRSKQKRKNWNQLCFRRGQNQTATGNRLLAIWRTRTFISTSKNLNSSLKQESVLSKTKLASIMSSRKKSWRTSNLLTFLEKLHLRTLCRLKDRLRIMTRVLSLTSVLILCRCRTWTKKCFLSIECIECVI